MIVDVFGKDMFAKETAGATRVIPTNCVGVMGAGVALGFKQLYGHEYNSYRELCKHNILAPGIPHFHGAHTIFFPTKNHWRNPSKISWIKKGVPKLKEVEVLSYMIIPPLGCGNGGLDWKVVYPIIQEHLSDCLFDVHVYHPEGYVPDPNELKFSTDHGSTWSSTKPNKGV